MAEDDFLCEMDFDGAARCDDDHYGSRCLRRQGHSGPHTIKSTFGGEYYSYVYANIPHSMASKPFKQTCVDCEKLRTERNELRSFLERLINHNKISDELQKDYFLLKARYR